jgi:ureidoglycolate lyase
VAFLIPIAPLTAEAFAPFGDVIAHDLVDPISINQGFAKRHNLQAKVDVTLQGGAAQTSIFVADPRPQPIAIKLMERHPLGSQSFYPLQDKPWLVVVCSDPQDPQSYRAFEAHGQQGVNYARNIWHHPLLVRDAGDRFFIVDRAGPGNNLEEVWLDAPLFVQWSR